MGRASGAGAEVASRIGAGRLREHVARLSADELEGRGPGTAGDAAKRAYLAERLASFGAQPVSGSSGWEQAVEPVGVTSSLPKTWDFQRGGSTLSLSWWEQYIAGSGIQASRGNIERAEVVFVGYGIQASEYGWDDFKGQDLRGMVLLVLNNDPDWDPALFAGATRLYCRRWTSAEISWTRAGASTVWSRTRGSSSELPPSSPTPTSHPTGVRATSSRRRARRRFAPRDNKVSTTCQRFNIAEEPPR